MHQNSYLQAIIFFQELTAYISSHFMNSFIKYFITSVVIFAIIATMFLLQAKHNNAIMSLCSPIEKMLVINASFFSPTSLADTALKPLLQVETSSKNEK